MKLYKYKYAHKNVWSDVYIRPYLSFMEDKEYWSIGKDRKFSFIEVIENSNPICLIPGWHHIDTNSLIFEDDYSRMKLSKSNLKELIEQLQTIYNQLEDTSEEL